MLLAVALLGSLAACGSSSPGALGADKAVNVVAAENFYGDIAAQLGGDRVHVTSIINDPESDPHLYESDARDAAGLADARVVIENGLGYDDFVDKLLGATRGRRTVVKVADVLRVTGDDANPHLWYDVPRIPDVARAIVDALTGVDPGGADTYQRNLATFNASLRPLTTAIGEIKAKYPGAPVAYTERVPGYLLDAAGLAVKSPAGFASAIEEGNEPSAGDTAAMNALMTGRGVKVLLYNGQATSPVTKSVRDLAEKNRIPVVPVTETIPHKGEHYQDWQLGQVRALFDALAG
jgi:zinc/manganese transport system substrate-binding protein